MSAQITNNKFANIGRMFARQNVPSVYGMQKESTAIPQEEPAAQVDRVSLSPFAPRPLPAEYLEKAILAGKTMGEGRALSAQNGDQIRQDRVFAAVSALALMGFKGSEAFSANWPGGLPQPTREEIEVARRRLAQRPYDMENAGNSEKLAHDRLELLQKTAKKDFQDTAAGSSAQTVQAVTNS